MLSWERRGKVRGGNWAKCGRPVHAERTTRLIHERPRHREADVSSGEAGHDSEINDAKETKCKFASTDEGELQMVYEQYCAYLELDEDKTIPEEMAQYDGIASVLLDVLKTVKPETHDVEYAGKVLSRIRKDKASFSPYNILPPNSSREPILKIPEIRAAMDLLRIHNTHSLPMPLTEELQSSDDLFSWLWQSFGFQKGNVENQKEHLILLLASIDMRNARHTERHLHTIHGTTVILLMEKIFRNYNSWCRYLHLESNIKIPSNSSTQQPELLYVGLYLLIWGEAANVRFLPECICYIFHNMAKQLHAIISDKSNEHFSPPFGREGTNDAFLAQVIQPIYDVMLKETMRSERGTARNSKWRNYDDFNEYFWSKKSFTKLGWPMNRTADFFAIENQNEVEQHDHVVTQRQIPKTNFVEVQTFLHLFRSFDRMWTFLILAFQAMVILGSSPSTSVSSIFQPDTLRNVSTIFITAAFLNFLQATLEIVLNWKAWKSLECSQMLRYIMKFIVAVAWLIILTITYAKAIKHPTGLVKLLVNWIGNVQIGLIYNHAIAIYMLPNILSALLFIFLPIRRALECSDSHIVRFILWWNQQKIYVARGMYPDRTSVLKYISFWVPLLMCKLAFSFYTQICPLIEPTKMIMLLSVETYDRHVFFPFLRHNLGVVITLWAPVVMVYIMDIQIWYAIFLTISGGVNGALNHLGEIQSLGMLRSRFESIPIEFAKNLLPSLGHQSKGHEEYEKSHNGKFANTWNAFISSLREEDLLSNREGDLLVFPSSSNKISFIQWPLFLLADKVPTAIVIAKDFKKDEKLIKRIIKKIPFAEHAIRECYESLLHILYSLIVEDQDVKIIDQIRDRVKTSTRRQSLVEEFRLQELSRLTAMFDKLLTLLIIYDDSNNHLRTQVVYLLQDIMEVITKDIIKNGQGILKDEGNQKQLFANINLDLLKDVDWEEKRNRLQFLLRKGISVTYVPANLEARRRITYFANSLFMKMPSAPPVRSIISFSVVTSYFKEDVLFSMEDLHRRNEDGISILFYLQKIFPGEWENFLQRLDSIPKNESELTPKNESELMEQNKRMFEICTWASNRGQTLTRTVRGMMYYRKALEHQCIQDTIDLAKLGRDRTVTTYQESEAVSEMAQAIADIKFTYVVSCQVYAMQKKSSDARDKSNYLNIWNLMIRNPSLRVAFIDEVEEYTGNQTTEKAYYSVLVKGGEKNEEEIYRIKLPGKPTDIGEGKAENLNHAIIFTRGEALLAIDMNQDNYIEEAFKMRNVLEEFESKEYGNTKPTILGLREHIFTGSVSSLAWFMSNQETSFATIGQRVLANPLKARFCYGHSDIYDRLFHITRGGISKASKAINLSENIFSGFNSIMRGGNITHHEYMQVGKGRHVGMHQISIFEAKVADGNGEQTFSRDIYRLGHRFDFFRMLSLYFSTVGFYFSSMVTVLIVYVFLYGRLYLIMSGQEKSILQGPRLHQIIKPLENALASQSISQLGLLIVLPMIMEVGLQKGFTTALMEFVAMQLQLASMFFTFQLGTKAHYYGRTVLHGGAKYRPVSHRFVVCHVKFAENYRMYSRSHFFKGLELLVLLVLYVVFGNSYRSSKLFLFVTFSIWFLIASWLFAPFIFNPSSFEWQKVVDDWADWKNWMGKRGGIGMSVDQSWEPWWIREQEHLWKTSICARLLEIILSLRFLFYQYGIVHYLNKSRNNDGIVVLYGISLIVIVLGLLVLKIASIGRRKFGTDLQLMLRILNILVLLGYPPWRSYL